jgi:hypothetical protein
MTKAVERQMALASIFWRFFFAKKWSFSLGAKCYEKSAFLSGLPFPSLT